MRRTLLALVAVALLAATASCGGERTTPTSNVPTLAVTPTQTPPTPQETAASGETGCRVVPPPITDQDHIRGAVDAPVTVLEYADFQ
jgi:protein-disulfide isomerase